MTKIASVHDDPFFDDPDFDAAERYGADALGICCRYQIETETSGIDLELHTYEALMALVRGGTLAEALACIDTKHPQAHKVVEELGRVAQRLADERYRPRARFLS